MNNNDTVIEPISKVLIGKKQICAYCKRSWVVMKRRIDEDGFPAKFINGRWESHTDAADTWLLKQFIN